MESGRILPNLQSFFPAVSLSSHTHLGRDDEDLDIGSDFERFGVDITGAADLVGTPIPGGDASGPPAS